jgi:hypothetical protein
MPVPCGWHFFELRPILHRGGVLGCITGVHIWRLWELKLRMNSFCLLSCCCVSLVAGALSSCNQMSADRPAARNWNLDIAIVPEDQFASTRSGRIWVMLYNAAEEEFLGCINYTNTQLYSASDVSTIIDEEFRMVTHALCLRHLRFRIPPGMAISWYDYLNAEKAGFDQVICKVVVGLVPFPERKVLALERTTSINLRP